MPVEALGRPSAWAACRSTLDETLVKEWYPEPPPDPEVLHTSQAVDLISILA